MNGFATRKATTDTADARTLARRRSERAWSWMNGLFFGSLLVWFVGFVLGLARRVAPFF